MGSTAAGDREEGRPGRGRRRSLRGDATYHRYEDEEFVRAFFEKRGTRPRRYEKRLLQQLVAEVGKRRPVLGLEPGRPAKLLDLGTGYGRDLAWLGRQPGFLAFGVDYSAAMLCLARESYSVVRRRLAQMDLRFLAVRKRSLDVVRAQAVFHHLGPEDADLAVAEIARVLKPMGLLRVFVRHGTFDGYVEEPGLGRRYFHYYTTDELSDLFERHHLTLIDEELIRPADPRRLTFLAVLAGSEEG